VPVGGFGDGKGWALGGGWWVVVGVGWENGLPKSPPNSASSQGVRFAIHLFITLHVGRNPVFEVSF
jgi:hypothetical protein